MVAYNTNYYRRNKEKRFKVHKCPHCNFETTGPKSSLQAHIWAKHTDEKDRPFQCPCDSCDRGYSARANLHKHIKGAYQAAPREWRAPPKVFVDLLFQVQGDATSKTVFLALVEEYKAGDALPHLRRPHGQGAQDEARIHGHDAPVARQEGGRDADLQHVPDAARLAHARRLRPGRRRPGRERERAGRVHIGHVYYVYICVYTN